MGSAGPSFAVWTGVSVVFGRGSGLASDAAVVNSAGPRLSCVILAGASPSVAAAAALDWALRPAALGHGSRRAGEHIEGDGRRHDREVLRGCNLPATALCDSGLNMETEVGMEAAWKLDGIDEMKLDAITFGQ